MNAQMSKRERLNYAAQRLVGWYFANRGHPLAARVLAKQDDVLGQIDSWWAAKREESSRW